jgi:hypothetical protein
VGPLCQNCRIPFAAIMLSKVLLVTGRYPGLYFVSYSAVLIAMCWMAIWIFGAAGAVSIPYGGYYVVLLIISLAWSIEVLRNIVNITVAGTVGTFYFQEHAMPRNPTLRALVHACTISFGSVCLGSLFVAIIQTLHSIAQSIANGQHGHEFLFSCVTCFLGILDNLIRYFNKWAFVQVRCGTPLHDISVLGFVGSICHSLREVHRCKKSLVFSM